jgi:hypothetical protein
MGGGNFVVPAQRVTDFISNRLSGIVVANISEVTSNQFFLSLTCICYSYNSPTIKLQVRSSSIQTP